MRDKNSTNSGFTCRHCGEEVPPAPITARNHCPRCLWSLHVDLETPGDRLSDCGGAMEPAALYQKHGEWVVVHRCTECGKEIPNHCSQDDTLEVMIDLTRNENVK